MLEELEKQDKRHPHLFMSFYKLTLRVVVASLQHCLTNSRLALFNQKHQKDRGILFII